MDQQQCTHERVMQSSWIEEPFARRVCGDCGLYLNRTANEIAAAARNAAARAMGREVGPTPQSARVDSPSSPARTL